MIELIIGFIIVFTLGLLTGILLSFYMITKLIQARPWVALNWFSMNTNADIPRFAYTIKRKCYR